TSLTACDGTNTSGAPFLQGGNSFNATATLGTADGNNLQIITGGTASSNIRATFDQGNDLYLGNGISASSPASFTISATGGNTAGAAGADLTIDGGAGATSTTGSRGGKVNINGGSGGGSGNNAGGAVVIQGGTAVNSGTGAVVQIFGGNAD